MRSSSISVFCLAVAMSCGAAMAQQKVTPGNDPTKAVGSQVEPMKKECPDQTATAGSDKGQHAPTAAVGQNVPPMTSPANCPEGRAPEQKK
jgi:hypothetical protein